MQALATALNPLVVEPDWFEFVDMDVSPSSESAITPYFIGVTEEDRSKARLKYGIAQMTDWVRPIIGDLAFDEITAMILKS